MKQYGIEGRLQHYMYFIAYKFCISQSASQNRAKYGSRKYLEAIIAEFNTEEMRDCSYFVTRTQPFLCSTRRKGPIDRKSRPAIS